jgi:Gpi18-like mannosyltransferase
MTAITIDQTRGAAGDPPTAAVVLAATVFVHWIFWDVPSPDVNQFLQYWYGHLAHKGLVEGFAEPFGDYSPPYLYLLGLATLFRSWLSVHDSIRLLSVAGSLLVAFSVLRLLRASGAPQPWRFAIWTPLLPTVFANAGLLSQCDALWVAPCLLAVAAAIERRHATMLAWVGLGFAFKGQTAFLAPFIFALLIQRGVPLLLWLIPPSVYALLMLPAWLAGWPAVDLALTYIRQGASKPDFISNASNPWVVLQFFAPNTGRALVAVGFALGAVASLATTWWLRHRKEDNQTLLMAALLSALLVPTLLPRMHERYFLLADVLAFVLALTARTRTSILVAILTSAGSAFAIAAYIMQLPLLAVASAFPTGMALLLVARALRSSRAD